MAISAKQLDANRRNAQLSTGPRTPEGKDIVRHNAVTHGILARETFIADSTRPENQEEFSSLLDGLIDHFDPQGTVEDLLVQQIAGCYWRLRRILRADALLFARTEEQLHQPVESMDYFGHRLEFKADALPGAASLGTINRYERTVQLQLDRAMAHLSRLQQVRAAQNEAEAHHLAQPPSPAESMSTKQTHFPAASSIPIPPSDPIPSPSASENRQPTPEDDEPALFADRRPNPYLPTYIE